MTDTSVPLWTARRGLFVWRGRITRQTFGARLALFALAHLAAWLLIFGLVALSESSHGDDIEDFATVVLWAVVLPFALLLNWGGLCAVRQRLRDMGRGVGLIVALAIAQVLMALVQAGIRADDAGQGFAVLQVIVSLCFLIFLCGESAPAQVPATDTRAVEVIAVPSSAAAPPSPPPALPAAAPPVPPAPVPPARRLGPLPQPIVEDEVLRAIASGTAMWQADMRHGDAQHVGTIAAELLALRAWCRSLTEEVGSGTAAEMLPSARSVPSAAPSRRSAKAVEPSLKDFYAAGGGDGEDASFEKRA